MNAYSRYTDGRAANEAITNRANYNAVMLQLIGDSPGIWSRAFISPPNDSEDSEDSEDSDDSDSEDSEDSDSEDSDISDISDISDSEDSEDSEDGDNGWRAYGGNGIDPDIWAAWAPPTRELAQ